MLERKRVGKTFEEVLALRPDFYHTMHQKGVTLINNGPVKSYGGPDEEFLPGNRVRYVFSIGLTQERTKALNKQYKLYNSYKQIPIRYYLLDTPKPPTTN